MVPDFSELRAKAQRDRIDFLCTDLDLCFTFADLVNTELRMEDREAALSVHAKAEKAYATITRFLLNVDGGPEKDALEQRLTKLRSRLDALQPLLYPPI